MENELVCKDCGCTDIKLVAETVKLRQKTEISYLIWLTILCLLIITGIVFLSLSFAIYMQNQNVINIADKLENTVYINKYLYIGLIILFTGIAAIGMTLLLNIFDGYKAKTRIIAVCPHCGKIWKLSAQKKMNFSIEKKNTPDNSDSDVQE